MNQYPSLQSEPNEFEQKLAALDPNDLNQFIFSVYFEEVGAVESEGEAWDRTENAGQGDADYLLRMESEFQAKLKAIKRNCDILLQDANQRAREYVFQIRWWAQRLEEVERKSTERMVAIGGSNVPPPTQPGTDPPAQTDLPTVPPPHQPAPDVSMGSAVDRMRAQFEGTAPAPSTPSQPQPAKNALDDLRAELEGGGTAAQPVPDAPPANDELSQLGTQNEQLSIELGQIRSQQVDPARLQELSAENEDLRRQLQAEQWKSQSLQKEAAAEGGESAQQLKVENEEMKARLQFIDVEVEGLRREAQKSESLTAQLENLRLQMEAERTMAESGAEAAPGQSQLEAEIEDLRNQLHAAQLESPSIRSQSDRETELAAQVESLTSQIVALEEGQPTENQTGLESEIEALKLENSELKEQAAKQGPSTDETELAESERVRFFLDEIERLRATIQEHKSRETSSRRETADPKDVSDARSRVERAQAQAIELANLLHEPLIPIAAEVPVVNENEPWALRERANIMEHIFGEMERQRNEYFTPAQEASWQIIDRLRRAGVDTEIYADGLKVGNVNASLILETFLKELEQRQDTAPRSTNTPARLLAMLNELELEVDERLHDVHQQVVPTGLISIGRKLISEYRDGARPTDPQQTVRNIIRAIRGYLDSASNK